MTERAALGAGPALPFVPDQAGRLPRASGPEKVRQSIAIILDTERGERVMLPGFGCGLRRYLMQPNSTGTRTQIQRDVEEALKNWEPRIEVDRIDVVPGDDPAMVIIEIAYSHRRDGRKDNLVFPLYLE